MNRSLRIVTWNCNMKLHAKLPELAALRPDIAIVPECSCPDVLRTKSHLFQPPSFEWIGDNPNKGLGVFGFGDYRLEQHASRDERLKWVLPVTVSGPVEFSLLAIWILPEETRLALRPIITALSAYKDLLPPETSVVAGDFNHNVFWDRTNHPNPHADTVAELADLGLVSAYHESTQLAQGSETSPTYFWYRHLDKGYHIDYCFVPRSWRITEHSIGDPTRWLKLSDHLPLLTVCEIPA